MLSLFFGVRHPVRKVPRRRCWSESYCSLSSQYLQSSMCWRINFCCEETWICNLHFTQKETVNQEVKWLNTRAHSYDETELLLGDFCWEPLAVWDTYVDHRIPRCKAGESLTRQTEDEGVMLDRFRSVLLNWVEYLRQIYPKGTPRLLGLWLCVQQNSRVSPTSLSLWGERVPALA